ncbi:MAG: competence protein ComEA, partial [Limisphaerales bacterium]
WEGLPQNTKIWVDSMRLEYKKADSLFSFDPNHLIEEQWLTLGVPLSVGRRIVSRVSKGNYFKSPEELLQVYGFRETEFEELVPYIKIGPIPESLSLKSKSGYIRSNFKSSNFNSSKVALRAKQKIPDSLDINSASESDFTALPGIGNTLARRAVFFREKLGGFVSVAQFGELYGLPPETYDAIKPHLICSSSIRLLSLNNSSEEDFKTHPYIPPWTAEYIIKYREKHNGFLTVDELLKVKSVSDSSFNKIRPYLTLE